MAQEQPEQLSDSPSPDSLPALMFTLPTPENDGWKSASPLPRSFLPPEMDQSTAVDAQGDEGRKEESALDRAAARKEALLKAMRRPPSLSALSTALGLQQTDSSIPARHRLSTSISSATLSRSQIATTLPNLGRRASVADPTTPFPLLVQRTKSGLPSLATLGDRLASLKERSRTKSAGVEGEEEEAESLKGVRDEVAEEALAEGEPEIAAAASLPTPASSPPTLIAALPEPTLATTPPEFASSSSPTTIATPSLIFPSIPAPVETSLATSTSPPRPSIPTTSTTSPPRNPASHPLEHDWTFLYQPAPTSSTSKETYAAGQTIGKVDTVEDFCRLLNWVKRPSQLEMGSTISVFKDGIKPVWEDDANANGGKWTLTVRNNPSLLDRCWTWLVLGLVGEELDERNQVCGAVVSPRARDARIQLWTRSQSPPEPLNALAKRLLKLLDLSTQPGTSLDFSPHLSSTTVVPNHFLSISNAPLSASPGPASEGGSRRGSVDEGSARRFEGSGGWRERNGGGIQGGVLRNVGGAPVGRKAWG